MRDDLAINGAPPAFAEPLHVGRPNLGDREAFLDTAARTYDSRWLTNNGPMVQEPERRVAERLGVRHCVTMCNGTIALEIADPAPNRVRDIGSLHRWVLARTGYYQEELGALAAALRQGEMETRD